MITLAPPTQGESDQQPRHGRRGSSGNSKTMGWSCCGSQAPPGGRGDDDGGGGDRHHNSLELRSSAATTSHKTVVQELSSSPLEATASNATTATTVSRRKESPPSAALEPAPTPRPTVPMSQRFHLSSSRIFVLQALAFWLLVCWPGNIMTLVMYHRVATTRTTTKIIIDENEAPTTPYVLDHANVTSASSVFVVELACLDLVHSPQCQQREESRSAAALMELCAMSAEAYLKDVNDQAQFQEILKYLAGENICPAEDGAAVSKENFSDYAEVNKLECHNCSSTMEEDDDSRARPNCHESREEYSSLVQTSKFWIEGVLVTAVGIVGIGGNVLTIIVLWRLRTNRNFNNILIGLVITDTLLIANLIVEMSVIGVFLAEEPLWYILAYPYLLHPLRGFIQTGTIYMVLAVATERFKSVCHPLAQRQNYAKFIVVAVVNSVTLELPRFFEFQPIHNHTDYWTTDLMEDPAYIQFNSYWNELLATGGIPLCCLIYMNTRIYLKIRASSKFARKFVGSCRHGKQQQQLNHSRAVASETAAAGGNKLLLHHQKLSCFNSPSPFFRRSLEHAAAAATVSVDSEPAAAGPMNKTQGGVGGSTPSTATTVIAVERRHNTTVTTACTPPLMSPSSSSFRSRKLLPFLGGNRTQSSHQIKMRKMVAHAATTVREKGLSVDKEEDPDELDVLRSPETNGSNAIRRRWGEAGKHLRSCSSSSTTTFIASRANLHHHQHQQQQQHHLRRGREKSTVILVSIVLIFIVCHTYRLSLRLYELSYPQNNTLEHYRHCRQSGLYHIPVAFYVLVNFHHLFLVINSSVNFIIYCCVGKEFRSRMVKMFSCW